MTTDKHSSPRWKPCHGCGETRPLGDFRRVYSGRGWPRHHECNACRNRRDREKRRLRRLGATKKTLRLLAEKKKLEQVVVVLNTMLPECGGQRGFGESLAELRRTGSPIDRRHANNAIMNLMRIEDAERARQEARLREEEAARASLSDPGMRASLRQLAIEELHLNAWSVCQVAARSHSDEAVVAVLEHALPTLRERLVADGWTPPADAAQPTAAA